MSRRRNVAVLTVVTLAVAATSATGASAKAAKKPAPLKTMKGSYSVTLVPDPTIEAEGQLGKNCANVDPESVNDHPLTLPGNGALSVVLDSPDPTGKGKTDWDLVILDSSGNEIDSSTSPTSHESTNDPGMHKGKVTIRVCNLIGEPTGNVSYVYKYH